MGSINWKIKLSIWVIASIMFLLGSKIFIDSYTNTKEGKVVIYEGASLASIGNLLEEYEVVKNGTVFYYYLRVKSFLNERETGEPLDYIFSHGTYIFKESDFDGLVDQLKQGPEVKGPDYVITVPEGSTILKMAEIFEKNEVFTKEEFLTYVQDPKTYQKYKDIYEWLPSYNENKLFQLEGYLLADTYYLGKQTEVETIVDRMIKEMDALYLRNMDFYELRGLTFDEVLTLASIVEAESKFNEDRSKVAQVFYNRLEKGMKLQSDITAAYANQEHKVMMTYKDIEVESPYNTYYVNGLPIGPINSPSKMSIRGVLLPENVLIEEYSEGEQEKFNALYFYARPSGETFYSETMEEHQSYIDKYRHEWVELNNK